MRYRMAHCKLLCVLLVVILIVTGCTAPTVSVETPAAEATATLLPSPQVGPATGVEIADSVIIYAAEGMQFDRMMRYAPSGELPSFQELVADGVLDLSGLGFRPFSFSDLAFKVLIQNRDGGNF